MLPYFLLSWLLVPHGKWSCFLSLCVNIHYSDDPRDSKHQGKGPVVIFILHIRPLKPRVPGPVSPYGLPLRMLIQCHRFITTKNQHLSRSIGRWPGFMIHTHGKVLGLVLMGQGLVIVYDVNSLEASDLHDMTLLYTGAQRV